MRVQAIAAGRVPSQFSTYGLTTTPSSHINHYKSQSQKITCFSCRSRHLLFRRQVFPGFASSGLRTLDSKASSHPGQVQLYTQKDLDDGWEVFRTRCSTSKNDMEVSRGEIGQGFEPSASDHRQLARHGHASQILPKTAFQGQTNVEAREPRIDGCNFSTLAAAGFSHLGEHLQRESACPSQVVLEAQTGSRGEGERVPNSVSTTSFPDARRTIVTNLSVSTVSNVVDLQNNSHQQNMKQQASMDDATGESVQQRVAAIENRGISTTHGTGSLLGHESADSKISARLRGSVPSKTQATPQQLETAAQSGQPKSASQAGPTRVRAIAAAFERGSSSPAVHETPMLNASGSSHSERNAVEIASGMAQGQSVNSPVPISTGAASRVRELADAFERSRGGRLSGLCSSDMNTPNQLRKRPLVTGVVGASSVQGQAVEMAAMAWEAMAVAVGDAADASKASTPAIQSNNMAASGLRQSSKNQKYSLRERQMQRNMRLRDVKQEESLGSIALEGFQFMGGVVSVLTTAIFPNQKDYQPRSKPSGLHHKQPPRSNLPTNAAGLLDPFPALLGSIFSVQSHSIHKHQPKYDPLPDLLAAANQLADAIKTSPASNLPSPGLTVNATAAVSDGIQSGGKYDMLKAILETLSKEAATSGKHAGAQARPKLDPWAWMVATILGSSRQGVNADKLDRSQPIGGSLPAAGPVFSHQVLVLNKMM